MAIYSGVDCRIKALNGQRMTGDSVHLAYDLAHCTLRMFCRLQAANSEGYGPASEEARGLTAKQAPPPPDGLVATAHVAVDSSATVAVKWDGAPGIVDTAGFAACASYEVEVLRALGGALLQRHSCPVKLSECAFTGLPHSTDCQVRLRCVGADGAGPGPWTVPAPVPTPDRPPAADAALGGLSDGNNTPASGGAVSKREKNRRGRKATSGEDEGLARLRGAFEVYTLCHMRFTFSVQQCTRHALTTHACTRVCGS